MGTPQNPIVINNKRPFEQHREGKHASGTQKEQQERWEEGSGRASLFPDLKKQIVFSPMYNVRPWCSSARVPWPMG